MHPLLFILSAVLPSVSLLHASPHPFMSITPYVSRRYYHLSPNSVTPPPSVVLSQATTNPLFHLLSKSLLHLSIHVHYPNHISSRMIIIRQHPPLCHGAFHPTIGYAPHSIKEADAIYIQYVQL